MARLPLVIRGVTRLLWRRHTLSQLALLILMGSTSTYANYLSSEHISKRNHSSKIFVQNSVQWGGCGDRVWMAKPSCIMPLIVCREACL